MKLQLSVLAISILGLAPPGAAREPQEKGDAAKPAAAQPATDWIKASERPAIVKALHDWLAIDDNDKRASAVPDLEKKLEKALKPASLADLLKAPDALSPLIDDTVDRKPPVGKGHVIGKQTAKTSVRGKPTSVEYAYCVPKNYGAQPSYPLILALPPAGAKAESYLNEVFKDDGFRDNYVLVAPTPTAGESWISQDGLLKLLGLVLRSALDGFEIDTDRIFIDGTAEGGEDALRIAGAFADLFAGVVVRSSVPQVAAPVNFKNLPLLLVHAADDAKMKGDAVAKLTKDVQAVEGDVSVEKVVGREHGACLEATPKILAWMSSKRRVLRPTQIEWQTTSTTFGRAYWLQLDEIETGADVVGRVSARIDRDKNTITITSSNVLRLRVLLDDRLVDLDKPIEITLDGKKAFSGTRERSLGHLLEECRRTGDSRRTFTASVVLGNG
jgi:hypothetical protein